MNGLLPTFEDFRTFARGVNRVPVAATLICDDLTPVSAFARLADGQQRAFLLESVVGGESVARYSFLGSGPTKTYVSEAGRFRESDHLTGSQRDSVERDPLARLERELSQFKVAVIPGLPPFLGGLVGYAGYDVVRNYERLGPGPADDRELPDLLFDLYESMVVFDHARKLVLAVSHACITDHGEAALRTAYEAAAARIDALVARLSVPGRSLPIRARVPVAARENPRSNLSRAQFESMVVRCQEYIRAGDIFQVVISQRLSVDTTAAPLDVYRALRVINPSPFMFYLRSPGLTLVGASPEVMCRVTDGVITNRPLAGTRRRGQSAEEDRALRAELLADPKERAEHIMLVDLGRNDVGRVAACGSVKVSDVMAVETYSHVMHLSTTVTGSLRAGLGAFDALRAALPVGTVSGAPKVRAMQIIDELEPTRRGPYAGAVGYIDFAGNMDTCIALRTLVMRPAGPPGGPGESSSEPRFIADAQAGAGIVAESAPDLEYLETMNKAAGLLAAIRMAEEQFPRAASPLSQLS